MIGIIGGTGLYDLENFTLRERIRMETPFGAHSGPISIGEIAGQSMVFLPRHGDRHQLLPGEVNYRANIWSLRKLGVRSILGVSAVGSLALEIRPGDLATPVQYIDLTKGARQHTFFGGGLVAHISTAEPVCPALHSHTINCSGIGVDSAHARAVYVCIEGPRFGSRAESHMLRGFGATLVGMTNVPEVFLAREAQMCYASLAVATDYDSWVDDPSQHAETSKVLEIYKKSLSRVQEILPRILQRRVEEENSPSSQSPCSCRRSLTGSVMTPDGDLSPEQRGLLAHFGYVPET